MKDGKARSKSKRSRGAPSGAFEAIMGAEACEDQPGGAAHKDCFGEPLDPEEITHPNENVHRALNRKPANALLQIIERKLRGKHVFYLSGTAPAKEDVERVFGEDVQNELGRLLLEAIISGDSTFAKTVSEAIKGSDVLFHRDREKELLEKCFRFASTLPQPHPRGGKMKRLLQEHLGRELNPDTWKRLSQKLRLQGPRGNPGKDK